MIEEVSWEDVHRKQLDQMPSDALAPEFLAYVERARHMMRLGAEAVAKRECEAKKLEQVSLVTGAIRLCHEYQREHEKGPFKPVVYLEQTTRGVFRKQS